MAPAPGAGTPPPAGSAWTAGPGAQGAPAGPWASSVPEWPGAAPAPRRGGSPSRLWGEATATTGGRVALAVAAVLGVVVLIGGAGLVGSWAVHRFERTGLAQGFDDDHGRGQGWSREGMGPYGGDQRAPGGRSGQGQGQGRPGPGTGQGPGQGRGGGAEGLDGLAGGIPGLGTVLHGEFTTTLTGNPTVMVVQTGEVTAYTAGSRLTVRSSDGYEATYTLDASTTTLGRATPGTGAQVRVIAAKDGMKAVVVWAVGTTG